ncbi:MAG TPA: SDR family oxidoreductase [Gammaproteobacteria bacterium]|jgi:NAD(P)-dependent dehydrogenase (short-subunit alcohol dehydrogenase family)|nr:SDR family oxidoreductase [Gammaproteobacteria bacterium]
MGMLENKVILVTGGSTGIGRATAKILGTEGAQVVIADLQDAEGADTVNMIQQADGRAEYHHVDVSDYERVGALIAAIVDRHGSLDGAFNNAGIEGPTAKILDLRMEDWDRVIRVNLTGVFICMKCEIEQMVKQDGGGSIVSTASAAGLVGIPGAPSYNAAKHGVVGLTKTVALEYASRNIRVNTVCPGFIETPMLDRVVDASTKIGDQMMATIPMRRVAQPSEIGDSVAWLMSDKSTYVTGVALPVDGGWVAQ